jgi:hypothetical protein
VEGNQWVYTTDAGGELVTRVTGFEDVNGVRCAVVETTSQIGTSPAGGITRRREWLAWDEGGLKVHRFDDGRRQVEPGTPVLRLKLGSSGICVGRQTERRGAERSGPL